VSPSYPLHLPLPLECGRFPKSCPPKVEQMGGVGASERPDGQEPLTL
jgi:hypothetical protein